MKLYNTLTRRVEEVEPFNPPEVTIYTCGPTVYDYPHIGNWFTFIRYDTLVRTLRGVGFNPNWVMNITDVGHLVSDADEGEDKLEKGARREGKTAWDVAKFYGDYFVHALDRLNITRPSNLPKATDHIAEQIELIQKLEQKDYTYTIDDGVYFDTAKLDDYGKLARLDIEHLKAGARVEANPQKRNATDFALWKLSPQGQQRDMEWDSPWGKGFPGWHLECSAMAMKYLGETIDIHGGGIDHIPVHHTNEITQSEAATGKPFARIWFHTNFILVDGKKISKSLGDFYTLEDVEVKGFDLATFRLLVLESHYRTEANFSWDNLQAAQNRLNDFRCFADLKFQTVMYDSKTGRQPVQGLEFDYAWGQIVDALQDDLNTAEALVELNKTVDQATTWNIDNNAKRRFERFLSDIDNLLGLSLGDRQDITGDQKQAIQARESARASRDFAKSDELRDKLEEQGIGLRDTPHGPIWYRV